MARNPNASYEAIDHKRMPVQTDYTTNVYGNSSSVSVGASGLTNIANTPSLEPGVYFFSLSILAGGTDSDGKFDEVCLYEEQSQSNVWVAYPYAKTCTHSLIYTVTTASRYFLRVSGVASLTVFADRKHTSLRVTRLK